MTTSANIALAIWRATEEQSAINRYQLLLQRDVNLLGYKTINEHFVILISIGSGLDEQ